MLITFSGIDGSGKSTQVALAVNWLQEQGYQPHTLHLTQWTWVYQIGERVAPRGEGGEKTAPILPSGHAVSYPPSFPARLLRQILSLCDMTRFVFLKWRLPNQDILICDRYFYDLGISAIYRRTMSLSFVRLMWRIAPCPDLAFFLDAHPQQAKEREQEGEHLINYYTDKLALYQKYAKVWPVVQLSPDELSKTQAQISTALTKLMEGVR